VIAPVKKQPTASSRLYELKITLRGSDPAIWRRIQVPGDIKLDRLHDVFQIAMGWTDSHLHQFVKRPYVYSKPSGAPLSGAMERDERRFRLADLVQRKKASFTYEYDFGDGWEHDVVVENTVPVGSEEKCAVCLAGENACPPEGSGGQAVNHPKHEARQQTNSSSTHERCVWSTGCRNSSLEGPESWIEPFRGVMQTGRA
jgi:hypothetical protein